MKTSRRSIRTTNINGLQTKWANPSQDPDDEADTDFGSGLDNKMEPSATMTACIMAMKVTQDRGLLSSLKLTILCLQETHLSRGKHEHAVKTLFETRSGMSMVCSSGRGKNAAWNGVAIMYNPTEVALLNHSEQHEGRIQMALFEFSCDQSQLWIVNVYAPLSNGPAKVLQEFWHRLERILQAFIRNKIYNFALTGDTNGEWPYNLSLIHI